MSDVPTYNGPALADWLDTLPETRHISDDLRRHIRHWRSGVDPSEQVVDAFLCRIEVHLSEVPPHVILGWPEAVTRGLAASWRADGRLDLVRAA